MKASETKLREIIEGTKQYTVPLFQRAYSWKKAEWEVLWDDISELCKTDNSRPHFMGSIVIMPTESNPQGITKYLLIDGQQRLTTIFILLSAVRDKAEQSEEITLAKKINDAYLVNPYEEASEYFKLQPTQLDRHSFHQIINNKPQNENNNICECYKFFERKIRQSPLEFQKIQNVICNYLSVVHVVLSHEDDPHLVFENLNAKGRPLTQSDLIRNYFFMRIDVKRQENVYEKWWRPMETMLGESLTEFIRHYLTKSGVDVKNNQVYLEIKDRISKGDPVSYLEDLRVFAEYYDKLLHPEQEVNKNVGKYIDRLNRLEATTIYPFLLNCYDDWAREKITEAEFIAILQILENFLIRRFVCNIQTRGLNRIFALLYSQVSKDTDLGDYSFVERLKPVLQKHSYPKDIEFKTRLKDVKLYGGSNRSQKAKLILASIEESYKHKERVSFDEVSIEHIMPQTLNQWWKEHLGEDWEITHELFLHSLGNITLTGYNSNLSNQDFLAKKTHFENSHLELNKYFHHKSYWRRKEIEERGAFLAERALQIWSYFGDESAKNSQPSMVGKSPKLLIILGRKHYVKSWRDVLETTLNEIADYDPDRFQDIVQSFPRFVGWDQKKFRHIRQLKNQAFIEVNLSATDIYTFCQKAIETAELSMEDWEIEYSQR